MTRSALSPAALLDAPMLQTILIWLGLAQPENTATTAHGHGGAHGHTHGTVDPTLATTTRGIWAIKWSFVILAVTAAIQLVVVFTSGSVALLADTIHNVGDAATAIPLWIAFRLVRRKPTAQFTYGLGRVEDLAGVAIVLIILISALIAMYEAINRLLHPQALTLLWQVAIAGFVGFVGNEVVAIFRIKVGREIDSAALIADGYHARTDGLTSLAVVAGAAGVWFGFPLADPMVGLLITLAIFGIVWQSSKAVFTRLLDGVDPAVITEIRHAAEHVPAVSSVLEVRARWLGHRLRAEVDVALPPATTVAAADQVARELEGVLMDHVPALAVARVRVRPTSGSDPEAVPQGGGHHHAPDPIVIDCVLAAGTLEIVNTAAGERMQFTKTRAVDQLVARVAITRTGGFEDLPLLQVAGSANRYQSQNAPAEPHEFEAILHLSAGEQAASVAFRMSEPDGHRH